MTDTDTDAGLIARARRGDDEAFRLLVVRYEPVVAATVIGMLGRGDDADDVGQETFIRFHRALDSFREESTLKTYLVRIAMNLSLNALKSRRRGALRFISRDQAETPVPDAAVPAVALDDGDERRSMVRRAVAMLGPRHQPVVVLRLLQDLTTKETAQALGIPEGTVLSRLSRAMQELKVTLAPYMRSGAITEDR
ncbi:MAG: RNA polymerase sigma factor [Gemmatimonadota bacterium]